MSKGFEANPDQNGTADMITLNAREAALAVLDASNLFGFAVKLLNLPAQGTHLLSVLSGSLRPIVGSDEVRALGGEHQPEQFHLMAFGKILDVD